MITNLKIKVSKVTGIPMDQVFKKLEAGKTITNFDQGNQSQLKLELNTDIETIKKVVQYIQELGKAGEK